MELKKLQTKNNVIFCLIFIVFYSCNNNERSSENVRENDSLAIKQENLDEQKDTITFNDQERSSCFIVENIEDNLDEIKNNASKIIRDNEDNCVIALLDSLTYKSIKATNHRFLVVLDSICIISDGYVSEYYMDLSLRLFYEDFNDLLSYTKIRNKDNCIRKRLVEALSMELSNVKDPEKKRLEINDFIKSQVAQKDLSEEERKFIEQLMNDIDPEMFD